MLTGALVRRQVGHRLAFEQDIAGGRQLEAGDQPEQRGLAAAGGAEQSEELVLADGDGDIVQGPYGIRPEAEYLGNALCLHSGYVSQALSQTLVLLPCWGSS